LLKIPLGHVEAGLRSYDKFQPFPEESNRRLISVVADLNFCPTQRAADNLLKENIAPESIFVTGNTVIDALLHTVEVIESDQQGKFIDSLNIPAGRMILVTGHRRENFGPGLENLCLSLLDIVREIPDAVAVYSVHPNPNVRGPVEEILGSHDRICLIDPPDYFKFVALMNRSSLIITDSGGIQEEAPSLKKPVLVVRNVTERPEAVEVGAAKLVGTDRNKIVSEAVALLKDQALYNSMIVDKSPFGAGDAAVKIADIIEEYLGE
jgi:UDP-N-acetylglucosamine 2-epimerase (non-hydrolysing)